MPAVCPGGSQIMGRLSLQHRDSAPSVHDCSPEERGECGDSDERSVRARVGARHAAPCARVPGPGGWLGLQKGAHSRHQPVCGQPADPLQLGRAGAESCVPGPEAVASVGSDHRRVVAAPRPHALLRFSGATCAAQPPGGTSAPCPLPRVRVWPLAGTTRSLRSHGGRAVCVVVSIGGWLVAIPGPVPPSDEVSSVLPPTRSCRFPRLSEETRPVV